MIILSGIIFFASIELYGVPEKTALPVFLPVVALGIATLFFSFSVMDAYEILVYNEEHMNKFSTGLLNRIRRLFSDRQLTIMGSYEKKRTLLSVFFTFLFFIVTQIIFSSIDL